MMSQPNARRRAPGLAAVAAIAAGVVGAATVVHGQLAGQGPGPKATAGAAVQASPTPSPRPSGRNPARRLARATKPSRPLTHEARARLLADAKRLKGTRYRYGGETPRTGFDCSGFSRYVYAGVGRQLPRTARAQYRAATTIPRARARPGDLVFFHRHGAVYHVAVYAGGGVRGYTRGDVRGDVRGGRVWQSPKPGEAVELADIWTDHVTFARY
ncbi:MAG: C40 family peptidase [Carbonactinosporaceae bacterium]